MAERESGGAGGQVEAVLPVVEVTLTEDRAQVARRGVVRLPAGRTTVRVDEVAPVLVDKTLRASTGSAAAEVVDARARRERVVAEALRPAALRALDAELEALEDRHRVRAAALSRMDQEQKALAGSIAAALEEMAEDASWGRGDREAWAAELRRLEARQEALRREHLEEGIVSTEEAETIARLGARRAAGESPRGRVRAWVEVELLAAEACEVELEVGYLVPGACWRPQHVARLEAGEGRLTFATEACVWQRTGEAWEDVELLLSTQRPSAGVSPPALGTDLLAVGPRPTAVVVEARDQQVFTTGLGREEAAKAPGLPGIDDGGDPLTLRARGRATVPSDGRPHRFELSRFETAARTEIVAIPELAEAAIWRCVGTNEGERPILAGPVELQRGCGLVGRTTILYVAPGESFPLGFGPEGSLRVHSELEVQEEQSSMLSGWASRATVVTVRVSNIGGEARRLALLERVPVSEIDKVQVAVDRKETTSAAAPDAQGHLRWEITVPPLGTETVKLRYVVKKKGDVHGL